MEFYDTQSNSYFVKPWNPLALSELSAHVRNLGFAWIELPVRPGFPCQPETIEQDLPQAVKILGIDISPGMLKEVTAEVKAQGLPQVEIMQMDGEYLLAINDRHLPLPFLPSISICDQLGHKMAHVDPADLSRIKDRASGG